MKYALMFLIPFTLISCNQINQFEQRKQDEIEMRKNYNNFIFSINQLDEQGLFYSAELPGVDDQRAYVKSLLANYMDSLKTGKIEFDDTGVVLTRFLGLAYNKYVIKDMDIDRKAGKARIRISVHMGYVNNIRASHSENGTVYYIPTKPWGTMNKIVLGEVNVVPRWDLEYVEYDVDLVSTEYEGYWRVKKTTVDTNSLKFKESDETFDKVF